MNDVLLIKTLNDMAQSLRGRLDTNKFLDYILPLLFLKYLKSDYIKNIEHSDNPIDDIKKLVSEIDSIEQYQGLFYGFDLDSLHIGKDEAERIAVIKSMLKELNAGFNIETDNADYFGMAYEYLLGDFMADGGKNGGEFYTPKDIAELVNSLGALSKTPKSIYDPTCGSGRLLFHALKQFTGANIKLYGQEKNHRTYQLARMNMILHGLSPDEYSLGLGDTLDDDQFIDKKFDLIVANPPYSVPWNASKDKLQDPRFSKAKVLAPKSKADLAFVLHIAEHLNNDGLAIIVEFPGILYRGNSEAKIRQYLIEDANIVDAVAMLPANLFYGTPISVCILILRKDRAKDDKVLFIDASEDFIMQGKQGAMTKEHKDKFLNTYKDRQELKHYSSLVSREQIKSKDFNLSVSGYVDKNDKKEQIDIDELNKQIKEYTARRNKLEKELDELINSIGW